MNHEFPPVKYPIPIYLVASRYLIYDVEHVGNLRAQHRVPGVLSGTLPQAAQQNVFLGLPLELMNEEARFLVESGLAYIVDDAWSHQSSLKSLSYKGRKALIDKYSQVGLAKATEVEAEAKARASRAAPSPEERKRLAAEKEEKKRKQREVAAGSKDLVAFDIVERSLEASSQTVPASAPLLDVTLPVTNDGPKQQRPRSQQSAAIEEVQALQVHHPTPATSVDLFAQHPHDITRTSADTPPVLPARYDLYRYLHTHANQYFSSPGLRFGCHFLVYPGDPLRFHSHFLANGYGWNEQIPLMDLVGSGRLGTGVKKGFLVGAQAPETTGKAGELEGQAEPAVRCFSIEWAGM